MNFSETSVMGAYLLKPELLFDHRGFFARTWCAKELALRGISPEVRQCSMSFNRWKGTLRGLHYQVAPSAENKFVSCTRGAIFDVVVDLRADSPTYLRHLGIVLSAAEYSTIYIPEGCAHGFQTLENNSDVSYMISQFHAPECAKGIRWNDPALGISWPLPPTEISERDRSYPDMEISAESRVLEAIL